MFATILFAVALFGFFSPSSSALFFIFILPIFGNKPGTMQANVLLATGMATQFGLSLSMLKSRDRDSAMALRLPWIYLIISFLSLFTFSFDRFWGWFKASQTNLDDLNLLFLNLGTLLTSREDDPCYPLLSVFWTFLSFSFAHALHFLARNHAPLSLRCAWALFGGLLIALLIGLLNYYGIVDLAWLRGLDPVVNPGGTQYRLQSWFGHSGWFAEFVTLLIPFSMTLLTLRYPFWLRVSLLLLLLLLGEVVLILTFQRGGWLSYPLTLLALWACIYVLRKIEHGEANVPKALRASATKILVSLPLTLLVSFAVLSVFGSQFGVDQYRERFKAITKASDRTDFIKAGFQLGALSPILGRGSESFALAYEREYSESDGAYYKQIDLPLHGTAHNLYAQTFAGKGILGLALLITMLLSGILRGSRFVLGRQTSHHDQKIVALACACSLLACFIYGFVQEVFYIQSLQYLVFVVFALLAALPLVKEKNIKILSVSFYLPAITVFFLIHTLMSVRSPRDYSDAHGCYAAESGNNGEKWRWCGVRSSIDIAAHSPESSELTIELAPTGNRQTNFLEMEDCSGVLIRKEVAPGTRVKLPLQQTLQNCPAFGPGLVRVKISYGAYFVPQLSNPESTDRRVLAFRQIL